MRHSALLISLLAGLVATVGTQPVWLLTIGIAWILCWRSPDILRAINEMHRGRKH